MSSGPLLQDSVKIDAKVKKSMSGISMQSVFLF